MYRAPEAGALLRWHLPGRPFARRIVFIRGIRTYPRGQQTTDDRYRTHDVLNGNAHDALAAPNARINCRAVLRGIRPRNP
jgi:hypothetical protein